MESKPDIGRQLENRVRALRETRGLSQLALAEAVHISRQSLSAIEAGRTEPSVTIALRIARVLECALEDVFSVVASGVVEAELERAAHGESARRSERALLAHIDGRWVAHALSSELTQAADGLVSARRGSTEASVELLRPLPDLRETLVLLGCAPALGMLADRVNQRSRDLRVAWLSRSSTRALEALAARRAHVAGVHLLDAQSGEHNVPDVRRCLQARGASLYTLARWEAGLVAARGNPRGLRGIADLARPDVRLAAREAGAGARRLLEDQLRKARLPTEAILERSLLVPGHLEVAHAVALGAADAGVAMQSAAIAYGLDFIPLAEERFDLVVPQESRADPRVTRLLDVLTSAGFRREMLSLGGYEVSACGAHVAEIGAA